MGRDAREQVKAEAEEEGQGRRVAADTGFANVPRVAGSGLGMRLSMFRSTASGVFGDLVQVKEYTLHAHDEVEPERTRGVAK